LDRLGLLGAHERIDHGAVVDASAVPQRLIGGGGDLQLCVPREDRLPAEIGRPRRWGRVEDPAATAIQEVRTVGMELDRAAILVNIAMVE
jgi:hypothetical protein